MEQPGAVPGMTEGPFHEFIPPNLAERKTCEELWEWLDLMRYKEVEDKAEREHWEAVRTQLLKRGAFVTKSRENQRAYRERTKGRARRRRIE